MSRTAVGVLPVAKGRIVSCLEGGYDLSSLARSATAHVRVLLGLDDETDQ